MLLSRFLSIVVVASALSGASCQSLFGTEIHPDNCVLNNEELNRDAPTASEQDRNDLCLSRQVMDDKGNSLISYCNPSTKVCEIQNTLPNNCQLHQQCVKWSDNHTNQARRNYCFSPSPAGSSMNAVCVECRTNADCTSSTVGSICDNTTKSCRPCRLHADCSSGVCNDSVEIASLTGGKAGQCIPSTDVVWATNGMKDCMTGSGTEAVPYCSVEQAVRKNSKVIRLKPGNYDDVLAMLNTTPVLLIGPGRDAENRATLSRIVTPDGAFHGYSDIEVTADSPMVAAIVCGFPASKLVLSNVRLNVTGPTATGIFARCKLLRVERSFLKTAGAAIDLSVGTPMDHSYIVQNNLISHFNINSNSVVCNTNALFQYNTFSSMSSAASCTPNCKFSNSIEPNTKGALGDACTCDNCVRSADSGILPDGKLSPNSSACIDKGSTPVGDGLEIDYFGNGRRSAGLDIGCHELK